VQQPHETTTQIQTHKAQTTSLLPFLYDLAPHKFGAMAQDTSPPNERPPVDDKQIKWIQQVIDSFLYEGRAVNINTQIALNELAGFQAMAIKKTVT
jgi:hypothetical protein